METTEAGAVPEGSQPEECPEPGTGQRGTEDPTAFILSRTRSEVHLLLDNISANPEVTIASLAARTPPPAGLPADWIEEVCEITWPCKTADEGPDEIAKQAALLIKTRDYLNGLAKPASGASIAFTLMVTQEENPRIRRRRARAGAAARSPSRSSLAGDAYPDLIERARNFRVMMSSIVGFAVAALVVTLMISWYLAIGNAALADFGTARARLVEAEARVSEAQTALLSNSSQAQGPQQLQPAATQQQQQQTQQPSASPATARGATAAARAQVPVPGQAPASNAAEYYVDPCQRALRAGAYPSAQLRDACVARAEALRTYWAIGGGLSNWAFGAAPETAAWLANLLGTAVLPVFYGFLGAIASVVRTWSRKIKASLLGPRDVQLSLQQLALGALVGACISLFIAAPAAGDGETAMLGPVALSSSAISFVAGFGVDSVFQALEALISRIFNIAPAGTVARLEGRHPG